MPNLEIELYLYGNLLFGKVTHQAKELTHSSVRSVTRCTSRFPVMISAVPQLTSENLFIQGSNKAEGSNVFSYTFVSEEQAKKAAIRIKASVEAINKICIKKEDICCNKTGITKIL